MSARHPVSGRLVGRVAELRLVDNALNALADPQQHVARLIEVVGEPGIGKTTLLTEIAGQAVARKCLVLSARASELECSLPFWLIVEALDEYVGTLATDRVEQLGPELGSDLGRLFPSLAAHAGTDNPDAKVERFRAHRAVCELLERLAAAQPVVLILDDVHWADPASVELLGALVRRPPEAAVLVVIALRPNQAPEGLSAALGYAQRVGTLDRLELKTLSEAEAAELMDAEISSVERHRIFEVSGGNPFYVEQLGRALHRTDQAHDAPGGASQAYTTSTTGAELVPRAVSASLYDELAGLSDSARRLAEGASVAGDPFPLDIAAAAVPMSTTLAMDPLDELIAADLVRVTASPQRFRFRHPLVRTAVYSMLSPGRRMAAHERVDHVLAERGVQASVRAPHVEVSARHGDMGGVALLRAAGDEVLSVTPDQAVRWYEACLRLLPPADARSDAPARDRRAVLQSLARAYMAKGAFEDARRRLLEALALVPETDTAEHVRLTAAVAVVEHRLGSHEKAHRRLMAAFDALADTTTPEAALLLTELTQDAYNRADFLGMPEWGARALDAAAAHNDRSLAAATGGLLAFGEAVSGQVPQALERVASAGDFIDALPDDVVSDRLDALVNLVAAEGSLDKFNDAVRHSTRALALARATGQAEMYPMMTLGRLYALAHVGRLNDAFALAEETVESGRLLGDPQSLAWGLGQRAYAQAFQGEGEAAIGSGERALRLANSDANSVILSFVGSTLGWVYVQAGQAERAIDVIMQTCGGPELDLMFAVLQASFHEHLTNAWLACGNHDEAKAATERCEGVASRLGLQLSWAAAHRAHASLALAKDEADAAAEHAFRAVRAADSVGAALDRARSRLIAGTALAAAGRDEQAGHVLDQAIVEFDTYGATRRADIARGVLAGTVTRAANSAQGAARAPRRRSAELTAREQEIADLVVAGKTNRQIADALFLSLKTVESHLGRIFRKLDVNTRTSMVRELLQR